MACVRHTQDSATFCLLPQTFYCRYCHLLSTALTKFYITRQRGVGGLCGSSLRFPPIEEKRLVVVFTKKAWGPEASVESRDLTFNPRNHKGPSMKDVRTRGGRGASPKRTQGRGGSMAKSGCPQTQIFTKIFEV